MGVINGPNTGGGLYLDAKDIWLAPTAAVVLGDVNYVIESTVDSTTGEFDTCRTLTGPTLMSAVGVFVVCMEDAIAAGAKGRWRLYGSCQVNCYGAIALADVLGPATGTGQDWLDQATSGYKIIAKAKGTQSSGFGLVDCDFDGLHGFGYKA